MSRGTRSSIKILRLFDFVTTQEGFDSTKTSRQWRMLHLKEQLGENCIDHDVTFELREPVESTRPLVSRIVLVVKPCSRCQVLVEGPVDEASGNELRTRSAFHLLRACFPKNPETTSADEPVVDDEPTLLSLLGTFFSRVALCEGLPYADFGMLLKRSSCVSIANLITFPFSEAVQIGTARDDHVVSSSNERVYHAKCLVGVDSFDRKCILCSNCTAMKEAFRQRSIRAHRTRGARTRRTNRRRRAPR